MNKQRLFSCLSWTVICIITLLCLGRCLNNGFTNWDDRHQLLDNQLVTNFSFQSLKGIFSSQVVSQYHPLVTLLFAAEYRLFGSHPFPYHFHSLLIHLANGILVYILILRMTGKSPVALAGALLFEIHPLQVQTVAWISARKDLLFAFFYLASFLCYQTYQKGARKKFYLLALVLFIFSLLSKALAVTLPLVLLLWYRVEKKRLEKKDWLGLIPFFCLALIAGLMACRAQAQAIESPGRAQLDFTFVNVILAFGNLKFYLTRLFFPVSLSPLYFFPEEVSFWTPSSWSSFFLVIPLLTWLWWCRNRNRHLLWGAGFLLINLFPVLRIIPFAGTEVAADRFVYLASLGYFYLAGWSFYQIARHGKMERILSVSLLAVMVIVLGGLSVRRCRIWKDARSFWTEVIRKQPERNVSYHMLAEHYMRVGRFEEAIVLCDKAVSLMPHRAGSYYLKSWIQLGLGDVEASRATFEQYVEILRRMGKSEQAERIEKSYTKILHGMDNTAEENY